MGRPLTARLTRPPRRRLRIGRYRRRHVGHTLIELLIAAALGASVIAAALTLQQRAARHNERVADHARMQLEGLAALDLLRTYALLAGYGDHLADARTIKRAGAPIVGCVAEKRDGNGRCALSDAVSDGIAIRYRADSISVWRSGPRDAPADCEGVALAALRGATVRAYLRMRADGTHRERRLHCSSRATVAGQPMVGGLDELRLRYWLDGARESLRAEQVAADHWGRVRGIDACVVVKGRTNRMPRPAVSGQPTCDSNASGTGSSVDARAGQRRAHDAAYARLVFRRTIALRNRRQGETAEQPDTHGRTNTNATMGHDDAWLSDERSSGPGMLSASGGRRS